MTREVSILVLDSGAPAGEEGRSFVADEPDAADRCGHATAVAGLIRQHAPGARLVCWKVARASGRVLPTELAMALFAAAELNPPPDIVNLSLACAHGEPRLHRAIKKLAALGVKIICAAGNDPSTGVGYPARYPECVSVGAIDRRGRRRAYSPAGADVSIVVGPQIRVRLRGCGWGYATGTSFACAIHSGRLAAALSTSRSNP